MVKQILQLTPGSVQQTINVYKPKYEQKLPLPFVVMASVAPSPEVSPETLKELMNKSNTLKLAEGQYFNFMHILGYKDLGGVEVLILHVNQEKKNADKNRYHLILSCNKDAMDKARAFVADEKFEFESSLQTFIAGNFSITE